MDKRRKSSLLDLFIAPDRRESLLAQVDAGLLAPLRGSIQHALLDPVRQHVLPPLERHVLAPLDTVLAPLEALANRVADVSEGERRGGGGGGAGGGRSARGRSGAGFRMPPFDPDRTGVSRNAREARAFFDRLRGELADNMPWDRQNPDQDPQLGGSRGESSTGELVRGEEEEEDRARRRERKFEDFAPVLAQIDFDAIPRVAEDVSVLLGLSAKYRGPARLGEAIFGNMVVCYPIIWDGDEGDNDDENYENESEVADDGSGGRRKSRVSKAKKGGGDVDGDRGKKKWIIKFPINGDLKSWKPSDARALASEVGTMRWLKHHLGARTRLNIPRVYHWDAGGDVDVDERGRRINTHEDRSATNIPGSSSTSSSDGSRTSSSPSSRAYNPIGAPFIMMQYVEGTTAHDAWFTRWGRRNRWRPEADNSRRAILAHVALAVSELGRFGFTAGGAPVFRFRGREPRTGRDRGEDLVAVGPARVLDAEAMLDRWQCRLSTAVAAREVAAGRGVGGGGGDDGDRGFVRADRKGKGPAFYCERTPIYRELGPWKGEDAEERFYTSRMDCRYVREDSDFGGTMMLRGYWKWFCDEERELGLASKRGRSAGSRSERGVTNSKGNMNAHDEDDEDDGDTHPFVLAHPDLSLHNIIIDTRGKFHFIGWSGVQAVPRAVGNEALPAWLCRDWNPFVHRWRDADWPWRYRHESAADTPWAVPVPDRNLAEEPSWKLAEWRAYYAECVAAAHTAWRRLEDEKRTASWRRWEAKEEMRRARRRDRADERDALERVRENLFATRAAGSNVEVKNQDKEKASTRQMEENEEEQARGRTRHRPGSEPISVDTAPITDKPHKPSERHVSFAAGTKPEASSACSPPPAPRPPPARPRRTTVAPSQPLPFPSSSSSASSRPPFSSSSAHSSSPLYPTTTPSSKASRTLLSILPLTLLTASGDPRARPFILQELFHRAEPSAPRWENFGLARLRRGALNSSGGDAYKGSSSSSSAHETVPRPYEIESAAVFRRLLWTSAGVPGMPVARGVVRGWKDGDEGGGADGEWGERGLEAV
jgi:hypothetical protein